MEYSVFIGHVRSKDNFMRSHRDPLLRLPPAYTAERAVAAHWVGILYYVLLSSGRMQSEMVNSLALALLSTALAPWAWFVSSHADVYADTEHAETIGALQLLIAQARSQVDSLVSHYSFFPVFLLLGLLSYVTLRWREWLVNSHTVQAALHDVGVLVGASIVAPDERAKDTVYELYRLLNAIHAVLYKSVVPHLPQDVAGLVDLGLLTSGEAELLEPTANKQRDVLVTWAGQKVEALRRSGHIAGGTPVALAHSILKLQASARATTTSSCATCRTCGSRRRDCSSTSSSSSSSSSSRSASSTARASTRTATLPSRSTASLRRWAPSSSLSLRSGVERRRAAQQPVRRRAGHV